jgi:hypothetical protein
MKMTCDSCGADTSRECAWLIETPNSTYWDGHFLDGKGFTPKVADAVRFSRFQDAEAVKHWLLGTFAWTLRTAQHCWVDSVPQ